MGTFKDITNQKFLKLTVINRVFKYSKRTTWKCVCECGNIVEVDKSNLGKQISCGCYNFSKEKRIKRKSPDFRAEKNPTWKGGKTKKICNTCNNEYKSYVKESKFCSKKCSDEHKKELVGEKAPQWKDRKSSLPICKCGKKLTFKLSKKCSRCFHDSNKGVNHYLWIDDRSKLKDDHRDRGGQLHREWSNLVKTRDCCKCKINNKDCKGRLEAHHILGWTEYPELRYDINNGITLCHAHHPRKRAEEKRLIPTFMELMSVSKK